MYAKVYQQDLHYGTHNQGIKWWWTWYKTVWYHLYKGLRKQPPASDILVQWDFEYVSSKKHQIWAYITKYNRLQERY